MVMTRLSDWQTRLGAYLAACAQRRFEWGRHDCGLFVSGAIEAECGVDPAALLRGQYRTRDGAVAAISGLCGGSSVEHAAEHLLRAQQCPEVAVGFAQRGDVVVINLRGRELLGLVAMDGRMVAPGSRGLLFFARCAAVRAWRVG